MKNLRTIVEPGRILAAALLLAWMHSTSSQTFSSGSTEADGDFTAQAGTNPVTVRAGGVYHYKSFTVPAGATVEYVRGPDNAPVVILVSGAVTIAGVVTLPGGNGIIAGSGDNPLPGGRGGPGGYNGGVGGFVGNLPPVSIASTAGQGPGGGAVGTNVQFAQSGNYGAPSSFSLLTPLFGGSGGGAGFTPTTGGSGGSGGGGGGAILIASSTRISVTGSIRANGGNNGFNNNGSGCSLSQGAGGSGGAIRLVAPTIEGTGQVQALRGQNNGNCVIPASEGRIRLEAFNLNFSGTVNPTASTAVPGAVWPSGNPALANVPTLQFSFIGTPLEPQLRPIPTTLNASYSTPDVALPVGTANPIRVTLAATNTPVGPPTVITVRLIPQGAASSATVVGADHTGSFASSSAHADLTLPTGVTVLQAYAAMNLTGQTASLFPLIDGEPVERVMVAAAPGEASTLSLVTKSGKERRLDQLSAEDQLRVALAWEQLKATRTE
jgi:hypothetical protein